MDVESLLVEVADVLNTTLDLDTLLQRVAEVVKRVIDYEIFSILLLNESALQLTLSLDKQPVFLFPNRTCLLHALSTDELDLYQRCTRRGEMQPWQQQLLTANGLRGNLPEVIVEAAAVQPFLDAGKISVRTGEGAGFLRIIRGDTNITLSV